jgi:hypothetical protein
LASSLHSVSVVFHEIRSDISKKMHNDVTLSKVISESLL